MIRIDLKQLANTLKNVVLATFMITIVIACNNDIQLISIYKSDGTLQCQADVLDTSIEEMQQELTGSDIQVYQSSKSHDGLMHMQLCGSPTGNINVFSIASTDLNKAKSLGFVVTKKGENKQ